MVLEARNGRKFRKKEAGSKLRQCSPIRASLPEGTRVISPGGGGGGYF